MRRLRTSRKVASLPGETHPSANFSFIEFRNSTAGPQACLQGSRLTVWEVVWIARGFQDHLRKTATHLRLPKSKVQAAMLYRDTFPDEIESAITEFEQADFESLRQKLPNAELFPPPRGK